MKTWDTGTFIAGRRNPTSVLMFASFTISQDELLAHRAAYTTGTQIVKGSCLRRFRKPSQKNLVSHFEK